MIATNILLLLLGTALATFGTTTYLANILTDPDPDTLRIARTVAMTGRILATARLIAWFGTHQPATRPVTLLLMTAALAAASTGLTRLAPPRKAAT